MDIPEVRQPPANPAGAIAQTRNWFLFRLHGEPQVYRRKAIFQTPLGTNTRVFVGDDFEPMGHMLTAKMPDGVSTVFKAAWQEAVTPPLYAGG